MDLVVLVNSEALSVVGRGRVVKPGVNAVISQATEILKRAQARDELMLEQSRIAYEQAREKGYREGRDLAEKELAERLARALAARQVRMADLAPTLTDIVVRAVESIVRSGDQAQWIAAALASVETLIRTARWAKLNVHPDMADQARSALASLKTALHGCEMIAVVCDPELGRTDCVLETDVGIANASLDSQLLAIRQAMEAALTGQSDPDAELPPAPSGLSESSSLGSASPLHQGEQA